MTIAASATASQLAIHKGMNAVGIMAFASIPPLFAVIEPITYSDIVARSAYIIISSLSAFFTLGLFRPKSLVDGLARISMSGILGLAFTEPVAEKIRPYMTDISLKDGAPISAAMPAAIFVGIVGWFFVAFIVWMFKSPLRLVRFWQWWRNKTQANFDAFLAEDLEASKVDMVQILANEKRPEKIAEILQYFGVAPDTKTKGGGQSQPTTAVTRTPSQNPSQEVKSSPSNDPGSKTKTIA